MRYHSYRFIFYLSFITILFPGCKKDPELWEIKNLNNNNIKIMGHGGMGNKSLMPMDSYVSLTRALETGADGVEMDVQMTADNVLVLYHSIDLSNLTGCSGSVAGKKWEDISACTYKGVYSQEKIIVPETFFNTISKEGKTFIFDCKTVKLDEDYLATYSNLLLGLINKFNLGEQCYIESSEIPFLRKINNEDAKLKMLLYTDSCGTGISTARGLPLYGIVIDWKKITTDEIVEAHRNNLRVSLFNMTSEAENIDALQMNPDFMETDKLEHLLKIFEKENN